MLICFFEDYLGLGEYMLNIDFVCICVFVCCILILNYEYELDI